MSNLKFAIPEFTVSEISQSLKLTLEETFSSVKVKGEISGLKPHSSGHMYFNLKDENAVINSVCWRGTSTSLKVKPEDGMEVICTGKITTYPARSNYQLNVSNIEISGEGALLAMLEQRKKKLAAMGFFDQARKKKLPYLPKTIGIITSPTGAVIKDILHRIRDRMPTIHVIVYGVQVQGNECPAQVAKAIAEFNDPASGLPTPDLIIVARGGGSIEDLWGFNDEIIAKAVYDSNIPIISAIGHETDTTIIDYVSDIRAPTPTAAAEIAVPVKTELLTRIVNDYKRIKSALRQCYQVKENKLNLLNSKLQRFNEKLVETQMTLKNQRKLLSVYINSIIAKKEQNISSLSRLLESYEYKKILKRGFTLIRNEKGEIIKTKASLNTLNKIQIEFADGIEDAFLKKPSAQGTLF